ncbi:hypothetical protein HYT58_01830 [Candidatus Woesearchaeota archaeon]|nr:hypothetical protein [Candidatus Woesearchaeota archaeon]
MAEQNIIFFIGILWALILDGILVERGNGYLKIRPFGKDFQGSFKAFIFYIIEIILISGLITLLSKNFIPNILDTNQFITTVLSISLAYASFKKDIFD